MHSCTVITITISHVRTNWRSKFDFICPFIQTNVLTQQLTKFLQYKQREMMSDANSVWLVVITNLHVHKIHVRLVLLVQAWFPSLSSVKRPLSSSPSVSLVLSFWGTRSGTIQPPNFFLGGVEGMGPVLLPPLLLDSVDFFVLLTVQLLSKSYKRVV